MTCMRLNVCEHVQREIFYVLSCAIFRDGKYQKFAILRLDVAFLKLVKA